MFMYYTPTKTGHDLLFEKLKRRYSISPKDTGIKERRQTGMTKGDRLSRIRFLMTVRSIKSITTNSLRLQELGVPSRKLCKYMGAKLVASASVTVTGL